MGGLFSSNVDSVHRTIFDHKTVREKQNTAYWKCAVSCCQNLHIAVIC